jgi:hypothetical protein
VAGQSKVKGIWVNKMQFGSNYAVTLHQPLKRTIHFLHIGKNAGTQIKFVAQQINQNDENCRIEAHPHEVKLGHLPQEAKYFFSIRNPFARFKSGFYSRKRKGLPRFFLDWSAEEKEVFSNFEHANDLAEALFDDSPSGSLAFAAMKSTFHLGQQQCDWFEGRGFFLKTNPPLIILRQENLSDDLQRLFKLLDLKKCVAITDDERLAHKNNYCGVPELSDKAKDNLRNWYMQDFEFYKQCCNWIKHNFDPTISAD